MFDNYDLFCSHDAHQERKEKRWLASLPECAICGEKIRDDECYEIGDELYCERCIENSKVYTENHTRG